MWRGGQVAKLGREMTGDKMADTLALYRGQKSPWDLAQWRPMTEGIRAQNARTIDDVVGSFRDAGITGAPVALATERIGEGANNSIMNLANQIRSGVSSDMDRGTDIWLKLKQMAIQAMQAEQAQDAQKQSPLSSIMSIAPKLLGMAATPFLGPAAPSAGGMLSSSFGDYMPGYGGR